MSGVRSFKRRCGLRLLQAGANAAALLLLADRGDHQSRPSSRRPRETVPTGRLLRELRRSRAVAADDSSGGTWHSGSTPGKDIPLSRFYIARPDADTAATINAQSRAFEVPEKPNVRFHKIITICLAQNGEITHIINNTGPAATPKHVRDAPRPMVSPPTEK